MRCLALPAPGALPPPSPRWHHAHDSRSLGCEVCIRFRPATAAARPAPPRLAANTYGPTVYAAHSVGPAGSQDSWKDTWKDTWKGTWKGTLARLT